VRRSGLALDRAFRTREACRKGARGVRVWARVSANEVLRW